MGGGRVIRGADAAALLERFCPEANADVFAAAVSGDAPFHTLDELMEACPPDRLGVPAARLLGLWAPLFGEFE